MILNYIMVLVTAGILSYGTVQAGMEMHKHGGDIHSEHMSAATEIKQQEHVEMGKDKDQMFLEKRDIDGYTVSYHVMPRNEAMDMGGIHNLMVKVEKDGKALDNLTINSKVIHPNKESETKLLMLMDGWYMAGYDLGHAGRHQVMILFKTVEGTKHKGGVYYE